VISKIFSLFEKNVLLEGTIEAIAEEKGISSGPDIKVA